MSRIGAANMPYGYAERMSSLTVNGTRAKSSRDSHGGRVEARVVELAPIERHVLVDTLQDVLQTRRAGASRAPLAAWTPTRAGTQRSPLVSPRSPSFALPLRLLRRRRRRGRLGTCALGPDVDDLDLGRVVRRERIGSHRP